jgi:hypothetical protein
MRQGPGMRAIPPWRGHRNVGATDLLRFVTAIYQDTTVQAINGASREDLLRLCDTALRIWPKYVRRPPLQHCGPHLAIREQEFLCGDGRGCGLAIRVQNPHFGLHWFNRQRFGPIEQLV